MIDEQIIAEFFKRNSEPEVLTAGEYKAATAYINSVMDALDTDTKTGLLKLINHEQRHRGIKTYNTLQK
jgi:hypothetical protein